MTLRLLIYMLFMTVTMAAHAQTTCHQRTFTVRDGLASNTIVGIDQDPHGLLWIATQNGLCCYDGYQFMTFRNNGGNATGDTLSTNHIAMIHTDSQGHVWLRTYDGGLYLFDTYDCRFINMAERLREHFGQTIQPRNFYATAGHTWITDDLNNLNLRIDDAHPTDIERMEVYGTLGTHINGHYIRKIETDSLGREWMITDQCRIHLRTSEPAQTFNLKPSISNLHSGLDTTIMEKRFVDCQGNLWYTSSQGLTLVNFRDEHIRLVPLISGQPTRSLLCRRDGTIMAGTQDGYIAICRADGHPQGFLAPDGRIVNSPQRFASRIYALFEDSKGRLWIGSKGDGCWVVDNGGTPKSIPLNTPLVYDFDEDADGNIWIATYGGGVTIVKPDGSVTIVADYPQERFERVRRITHDQHGTVYVSTTNGLLLFNSQQRLTTTFQHAPHDTTSLLTGNVMQTLATNSTTFVCTMGGGMQQLIRTEAAPRFSSITQTYHENYSTATSQGNILSMIEDPTGKIWLIHDTGITCYDPTTGAQSLFSPGSMTESVNLTEAKPAIDHDGRIWAGAVGGIVILDTRRVGSNANKPPVVFTEVQFHATGQVRPLLYTPTLTLTKEQRSLSIRFAALDYDDSHQLQYAYQMDDDNTWNIIGQNPVITFNQLSPGQHTLRVRSTDSNGTWADNDISLTIDVTPLPWERTWVQLLSLLIVIALSTWAVIRWLQHRQHAKERERRLESILHQYRELQQQLEERGDMPKSKDYTLQEPEIANPDEEMMNQLMAFIEQHIGDDDLKIEQMAEAVNMSRTTFYERMRHIVGVSPSDFLRQVRMQRAMQLVSGSKMSVSQIAYAIGFTDPKYFAKCFKKETGMTPSEYREKTTSASASN